jgi:hypothetical protein
VDTLALRRLRAIPTLNREIAAHDTVAWSKILKPLITSGHDVVMRTLASARSHWSHVILIVACSGTYCFLNSRLWLSLGTSARADFFF